MLGGDLLNNKHALDVAGYSSLLPRKSSIDKYKVFNNSWLLIFQILRRLPCPQQPTAAKHFRRTFASLCTVSEYNLIFFSLTDIF